MSIASMTGFARHEGAFETWSWVWEARSVNGRGLDVRMRVPNGLDALEPQIRAAAKAVLRRGNVQVSLRYERDNSADNLVVHADIARKMVQNLQALVAEGLARPASVDGLLGVKGVMDVPRFDDDPALLASVQTAMATDITALFAALAEARSVEGAATAKMIEDALNEIEDLVAKARVCAGAQPEAIKQKLHAQITTLVDGQSIDAERLAQEAAILALKADVREELDRLGAHIIAGRKLLQAAGAIGRKLEFLTQEFNREANTLCSKSSDMILTEIGLALKNKIDQIREQAANVE